MTTLIRTSVLVSVTALSLFVGNAVAQPFTYQGELRIANVVTDFPHDFEFRIFDTQFGGVQIGNTTTHLAVAQENGRFTRTVNPGTNVFTGLTRWLEVRVRPSGGTYTTLSRQRIEAAPYAMRSLNERWNPEGSSLTTDPSISFVGIGTSTPIFSDTAFVVNKVAPGMLLGGMYVNTTGSESSPYYGWSTGNASRAEARVTGLNGNFLLQVGSVTGLTVTPNGNFGLGTTPSGPERLQVSGSVVASGTSTAAGFAYSAAQTRVVMVPPEAFRAAISTDTGMFGPSFAIAYLDATVAAGSIVAPLNLPNGATIVGMDAYVADASSAADMSVSIKRRDVTTTSYTNMALVNSSGSSSSLTPFTTNTVANPVIDMNTYTYSIHAFSSDWQGPNLALRGVRVRYTVANPE